MTKHDDGGQAFAGGTKKMGISGGVWLEPGGMTLYDVYVGMASIVLILSAGLVKASNDAAGAEVARLFDNDELVKTAEEWADAMIARKREREKEE